MKEKKEYKETAEWKNPEEALLDYEETTPLYDPKTGELRGYHTDKAKTLVKRADMEYNLQLKKDMVQKAHKEKERLQEQIAGLGKKPVKTSEMIRLEKNLQALQKINQFRELEDKIREKEEFINNHMEFIMRREATLKSAPKREEESKEE